MSNLFNEVFAVSGTRKQPSVGVMDVTVNGRKGEGTMKKNELRIFVNAEFGQIRTVIIDNEPWFVGKDVATALGYKNQSDAIAKHVSDEDKKTILKSQITTLEDIPNRGFTFVNESGLYALIFGSKLESAQRFKHWVTSEVLPEIRRNGAYAMTKKSKQTKIASMTSATNAVKTLTPLMQQAGFSTEIQLLTAKALYQKADCELPFEIKTEQPYYDTVHIARELSMFTKTGKPASDAAGNIIKKLDISDSEYIETLESKGNWQGSVKKYAPSVIDKAREWIVENGYPEAIPYTERSGKEKFNHVVYREVCVNEIIKE